MKIEKLFSALEGTITFLRGSQSSPWANISTDEIIQALESEITRAKNLQPIDARILAALFAPTGPIQETAMDNGWGDDYLRISAIVDHFSADH